jgi:hypothetical protein
VSVFNLNLNSQSAYNKLITLMLINMVPIVLLSVYFRSEQTCRVKVIVTFIGVY